MYLNKYILQVQLTYPLYTTTHICCCNTVSKQSYLFMFKLKKFFTADAVRA